MNRRLLNYVLEKCIYCFCLAVLVLMSVLYFDEGVFSDTGQTAFEYSFNKAFMTLNETFKLGVEIKSDSEKVKILDFDKAPIKKHGFEVVDFSYSIINSGDSDKPGRITYRLNFEIGLSLGDFGGFGDKEFPSFEISLSPTELDGDAPEIYQVSSKKIRIKEAFSFKSLFMIIGVVGLIVIGVFIIFVVFSSFLKRNTEIKRETSNTELVGNIYRRFVSKKEVFRKNKDIEAYMSALEKIITSYVLRKNSVTNLFELFNDSSVPADVKAGVRKLLRSVDKLKTENSIDVDDSRILSIEEDFKSLIQIGNHPIGD